MGAKLFEDFTHSVLIHNIYILKLHKMAWLRT
ncbi:MAG: hypothetical protein A4E47_00065 [Methanosaeta sp. PtaU1.Bin028]|nr:MAG: hypothetical protein A4E47_00065 [Methanosaeta sp. PtaU1.Bin028]